MQKLIALFLCGILARNLYAMPAYVAEERHDEGIVVFVDYNTQNKWVYNDPEDRWHYRDTALIIMFDNFTAENYEDDIIVNPEGGERP